MLVSAKSSRSKKETQTLEYYERNADTYFRTTLDTDVSALHERFLRHLPAGAHILDAGSGSGRDTLAFLQRGYVVSAFDSSPALCELSTRLTGVRTHVLRFQDLEDVEEYDGIWACASLLHVQEADLPDTIARLVRALKPGGALYMSFKHGRGERVAEDGRFFTDLTGKHLRRILKTIPGVRLEELWISSGEGKFQGQDEWLNAILLKQASGEHHG